jgi:energy-coupling factor transporter ATP-binding protein EcfA2
MSAFDDYNKILIELDENATLELGSILAAIAKPFIRENRIIIGLDGEQGSGKSTLVAAMAGFLGYKIRPQKNETIPSFVKDNVECLFADAAGKNIGTDYILPVWYTQRVLLGPDYKEKKIQSGIAFIEHFEKIFYYKGDERDIQNFDERMKPFMLIKIKVDDSGTRIATIMLSDKVPVNTEDYNNLVTLADGAKTKPVARRPIFSCFSTRFEKKL